MSARLTKPEWAMQFSSVDAHVNLDTVWGLIDAMMPPYPVFTTDLDDTKTCTASSSVTLTIACASPAQGSLTYQWQKMGDSDWADIASATSATYTVASWASATNDGEYRCVVTNTFNNFTAVSCSNVCTCTTAS